MALNYFNKKIKIIRVLIRYKYRFILYLSAILLTKFELVEFVK